MPTSRCPLRDAPTVSAEKLDEMFEEDEEEDAATGSAPLPDMKTSAEAAAPKGGNAAEAKARLLSLSQVRFFGDGDGDGDGDRVCCLRVVCGCGRAVHVRKYWRGKDATQGMTNSRAIRGSAWRMFCM